MRWWKFHELKHHFRYYLWHFYLALAIQCTYHPVIISLNSSFYWQWWSSAGVRYPRMKDSQANYAAWLISASLITVCSPNRVPRLECEQNILLLLLLHIKSIQLEKLRVTFIVNTFCDCRLVFILARCNRTGNSNHSELLDVPRVT